MAYFHTVATLTGGADVDYIFGTTANPSNLISGGDSSDLIVGDLAAVVPEAIGNTTLATAQNIDLASYWSTTHNPLIDPSQEAIPHTLVYGSSENGADYYQVSIEDGAEITIDIDWATFDTYVQILDKNGQVVAENDDSAISLGGGGSKSASDSYLNYTSPGGDTFYIRVYNANHPQEYRVDGQYVMNVMVQGHNASATLTDDKDVIDGGVGDDLIYGTGGGDTISGGVNNDTIYGGDEDDTLDGGGASIAGAMSGVDTIYGEGGDDIIVYSATQFYSGEIDAVDGGQGSDELEINGITSTAKYTVDLASGTVRGGASSGFGTGYMSLVSIENATVTGNIDVVGDSNNNMMTATSGTGANTLIGGAGHDTIHAGGGNDLIRGGTGQDTMFGEAGDDVFSIYAGELDALAETYDGGADTDKLEIYATIDNHHFDFRNATVVNFEIIHVLGSTTNTDTYLRFNADQISGTSGLANVEVRGNNTTGSKEYISIYMNGASSVDLSGWTFVDWGGQDETVTISGQGLNETMTGTSQNDRIFGFGGDDIINAGDGDDYIVGGAGADTINGGNGFDTLSFSGASTAISLNLLSGGTMGDATGDTYSSIEQVNGTNYDDTISGGSLNNTFYGGDGDDTLNGGFGDDVLYGGNGNDFLGGGADDDDLNGDADDDILSGGFGADALDGGTGFDTATYQYVGGAVTINLLTNTASGSEAAGDTFVSIEALIGSAHDDSLTGDDFDNQFEGMAGADTIDGGLGTDTASYMHSSAAVTVNLATGAASGGDAAGDTLSNIEGLIGSAFNDNLSGNSGNNVLSGLDGDDVIAGGLGNDTIDGGDGNDTIYTGHGFDTANGGLGDDFIAGGDDGDTMYGGDGVDTLNGGAGNDLLNGDAGNDTLSGQDGNDTLNGGDGIDTISGGNGDDTIFGGLGDDALYGGNGVDTIDGGDGADSIVAASGNDHIIGGAGDDVIYAGAGANTVSGGADNDTILGGELGDTLNGDAGNDGIYGQDGDDTLNGGAGNDGLSGQAGNDTLNGGAGVDTLSGADGNDMLDGGTENDLLYAGTGNDTLIGGAGDDVLFAGDGIDDLTGGAGNDRLYGQAGTNNLYGGAGDDNYYGGSGVDTYQFNATDGAATERVSLFQATDIIQLNGFGFANAAAAASSFVQSGGNVLFNSGGVQIVFYGATLADVQAAVQVDGMAELPTVDKHIVSETPGLPQDAIAEFLDTASIFAGQEEKIDDGFDTYLSATDLIDGHGFDLM